MALSARPSNTFWQPNPKTHDSDVAMARPGFLPARVKPTFGKCTFTPPQRRVFFSRQIHHVDLPMTLFSDTEATKALFAKYKPTHVIHLAALGAFPVLPIILKRTD
jgi:hypothetical protein